MRTRSSSNLIVESSTTPKRRNRRRSKQRVEPFSLEETSVVTMADQRTMTELLQAPTEGYGDAIVIPAILAENFELKHGLLNLVTSKQFYGFEKEDPHAHIHWFNKITSTIKYKDVPNSSIKLMLFPFSIEGAARIWLEKEPPRSILTWEDLVSKFINQFFPPSKTTNLRNKITNFQQKFEETFSEAWDRFKDLLRACPHYGFTELHQLDTFYNVLNPTDQDSLNAAAGGNLLTKTPQDALTIIKNKSKVRTSRNKPVVSKVNASSKVHEQMRHEKRKTIIQTSDDNQIDSNIIFDDPYVENNGGTSDHDSNDPDEYHKIQMLAYDVQGEVENQKRLNNELKKQKMLLQKELETSKKAFKERENRYLEDICYLEEKLSSHDRIVYKMGQSIQTIHMLGNTPNKVYDPFLKTRLGYKNPEPLKKAIAAQPKMYDGEKLHSVNLNIDSPDSEETLEDAEESRLKMRNKMVQINYGKLNALYETFVPQQDFSTEQTYFSIPSTSTNGSESKAVTSDLPIPKMPKDSKLLKMFDTLGVTINSLRTRIDDTLLEDRQRRWMSDSQNSLREFYKTDVILMFASLSKNLKELKEELIVEKNELLKDELVKSSSDSKDIQANLLKRIEILKNNFKLSTLNDKNVLLKSQVDSVIKERENVKLEYQKLFNSIKAKQTQHKKELDELIEHVNQKTYSYADVCAQNQDLLITIYKLKNKLKTVDKGKNVNTKFDKFEASRTLLSVTPFPKNIAIKANKVSNSKVNADRSKPVTSHPTPTNEQGHTKNENVLARGMYRITKTKTQISDSKTIINVSNSTSVESSNGVRSQKSKDTKSKNRVLKNTNAKSSTAHVWKMSHSVSIDSNKCETLNSTLCHANKSVLNTKSVTAVNDGSNIVCVSYGKDVFLLSHEKCVARYALSRNSNVKRACIHYPRSSKI
ncbi:reverse transcriptase domain-containing protein [Tanacetum coccineum]